MPQKKTLKQLIEHHEKNAAYTAAKADEFARRAKESRERAERLRREAMEAVE